LKRCKTATGFYSQKIEIKQWTTDYLLHQTAKVIFGYLLLAWPMLWRAAVTGAGDRGVEWYCSE